MSGTETVTKILEIEWEMFDATQNEGGRASCQENKGQFLIMRRSQFSGWDAATLESYLRDLETAKSQGRNLMVEKYGYMMERTAPLQFSQIKDRLPTISEEKRALADTLVEQTVQWAEEFHAKYPKVASHGRPVHKSADNLWTTSIETYNLGEMLTHGEETLRLLGQCYAKAKAEERNLYTEILRETARLSGFNSLEEAEAAQ